MTTKSKMLPLNQRSTIRGVSICKFCGTLNGNKSKNCKNELCILHNIFTVNQSKKNKKSDDPIQLITYNNMKIYSVQEKQLNQRNFVEKNFTLYENNEIINSMICYANECKIEYNNEICNHIKQTEQCNSLAKIIKIDKVKLFNLDLPINIKDIIWKFYELNETSIPIVQEIKSNLFVVAIDKTKEFPSGRIHISIENDNVLKNNSIQEKNISQKISKKFICSCKNFEVNFANDLRSLINKKICGHAQLLIPALLSSENNENKYNIILSTILKSIDEFSEISQNFLDTQPLGNNSASQFNAISDLAISSMHPTTDIELIETELPFDACVAGELEDCQIELMDEFQSLTNQLEFDLYSDDNYVVCDENELFDNSILALLDDLNEATTNPQPVLESSKELSRNEDNLIVIDKNVSVSAPTLEFDQWLLFVIESINDSLDYNATETDIELFFHISEEFMNFLQKKFSPDQKKVRAPNTIKVLKAGRFKGKTLMNWKFSNYNLLKFIFSNSKYAVEFQRNFQLNTLENFYETRNIQKISENIAGKSDTKIIEPTLFSCFLYLGVNKPFEIDWIANVNEKSKFGILFIKYNLGFKINNKIVQKCNKTN